MNGADVVAQIEAMESATPIEEEDASLGEGKKKDEKGEEEEKKESKGEGKDGKEGGDEEGEEFTVAEVRELDREALKALNKENDLGVKIEESMSDEDLAGALISAAGLGEDGEEEEDGEKKKGEKLSELDLAKKQNEILQQQLDAVLSLQKKGKKEGEEEEEEGILEKGETLGASEFLGPDDDLEAIIDDKGKLNEVLNKVASTAYTKSVERVYKAIPSIVSRVAQVEVANHMLAADFLRANPDLLKHRKFVGFVYDSMAMDNPDKTSEDIFKGLAKEVRMRLGVSSKSSRRKGKKVSFAPGGGTRRLRKPSAPSGIAEEISKMESV
jgi:hypothetical protein